MFHVAMYLWLVVGVVDGLVVAAVLVVAVLPVHTAVVRVLAADATAEAPFEVHGLAARRERPRGRRCRRVRRGGDHYVRVVRH